MPCYGWPGLGRNYRSKALQIYLPGSMTSYMERKSEGIIIADTSGLVSLFLSGDHNHKVALKAARQLQTEKKSIFVPAAVLVELLNILGRKVGHTAALAAVSELYPPFVVLTTQANVREAKKKFAELPQSVSFTDCLVMATADEYATSDIFGFDKQFEEAGYTRLEPSTEWKQTA
jgi:predicted nucleic acid-binding protein